MRFRLELTAFEQAVRKGRLATWLKHEGDEVRPGEDLCEIVLEHHRIGRGEWAVRLTAAEPAFLRRWIVRPGDPVRVGQALGILTSKADEPLPEDEGRLDPTARLRVVANLP